MAPCAVIYILVLVVVVVVDVDGLQTQSVHEPGDGHGRVAAYRRDSQTDTSRTKA